MTRDEAKSNIKDMEGIERCKSRVVLMDEIYNDFESRTCINCMFYHKGIYPDDCWCDKDVSLSDDFILLEDTFGCNMWEPI